MPAILTFSTFAEPSLRSGGRSPEPPSARPLYTECRRHPSVRPKSDIAGLEEPGEQARLSRCSRKANEAAEAARHVATAGYRSRCVGIGSGLEAPVRSASDINVRFTANARSIPAASSFADG